MAEDEITRLLDTGDPDDALLALKMQGVTPEHLKMALNYPKVQARGRVIINALKHPLVDKSVIDSVFSQPNERLTTINQILEHTPGIIDGDWLGRAYEYANRQNGLHEAMKVRDVIENVCSHPKLPIPVQKEVLLHRDLSGYGDPYRNAVLNNPSLDKGVLADFAHKVKDKMESVLADKNRQSDDSVPINDIDILSQNPNIPTDVADFLLKQAENGYSDVPSIAKNPAVSDEAITHALKQGEPSYPGADNRKKERVRRAILANPNIQSKHLDIAVNDTSPEVAQGVFSPAIPAAHLVTQEHVDRALNSSSKNLQEAALSSPVAQPRHFQQVMDSPAYPYSVKSVAARRLTPAQIANYLNEHLDNPELNLYVFSGLRSNPNFDSGHFQKILSDPKANSKWAEIIDPRKMSKENWKAAVLSHNGTIAKDFIKVAKDPEILDIAASRSGFHPEIAHNPNTSPETLRKLVNHVNPGSAVMGTLFEKPVWAKAKELFGSDPSKNQEFKDFVNKLSDEDQVDLNNPVYQKLAAAMPEYFNKDWNAPGYHPAEIATLTGVAGNDNTPPDVLNQVANQVVGNSKGGIVLSNLAVNPNLDRDTGLLIANSGDENAIYRLTNNKKAHPDVLRAIYQKDGAQRLHSLASNPNTPQDILVDMAHRNNGESVSVSHGLLNNPNVPLEVVKKIHEDHGNRIVGDYDEDALHSELREKAGDILELHSPDDAHTESVNVKMGTNKLRKIRDYILGQGVRELHPKQLPPGDWSVGRNGRGNIDADKLQQHIENMPATRWNVSHDEWDGPQRHNEQPSKVFQLNLTNDKVKQLKEAGVWDTFKNIHDASFSSGHPVKKNTIGWVRYTTDQEEPDWGEKAKLLGREYHGFWNENPHLDSIENQKDPTIGKMADEFYEEISRKSRSSKPIDTAKVKPFIDWARSHDPDSFSGTAIENILNPAHNKPNKPKEVMIEEIQSDFGQSLARRLSSEAKEHAVQEAKSKGLSPEETERHVQEWQQRASEKAKDFPEDKQQKILNILTGGKKINEIVGEAFVQHLRDTGNHDAKIAIHSPKSKAPISGMNPDKPLPGHMQHTYETIPTKAMGWEPAKYGDLKHQDNPQYQGAPTYQGEVRKYEAKLADFKERLEKANPLPHKDILKMKHVYPVSHGVLTNIPVDSIQGLDPEPADWTNDAGEVKQFIPGEKILNPITVEHDSGVFSLLDGNHRVKQAKLNGDKTISALVHSPDKNYSNLGLQKSMDPKKVLDLGKEVDEDFGPVEEVHIDPKEVLRNSAKV